MPDHITTCDGERVQTEEERSRMGIMRALDPSGPEAWNDEAIDILAAISAGKVPGVCLSPDIAIATAYQCAEDALASERDQLRAEVARLNKMPVDPGRLIDIDGRLHRVDEVMALLNEQEAISEGLRDRAEKAEAELSATRKAKQENDERFMTERGHLLQKVQEYEGRAISERCRADRAESRHSEAVALLREWRDDDGIPSATHTCKRGRTDAHLAACDGKGVGGR